jgi:hypothetical protein
LLLSAAPAALLLLLQVSWIGCLYRRGLLLQQLQQQGRLLADLLLALKRRWTRRSVDLLVHTEALRRDL